MGSKQIELEVVLNGFQIAINMLEVLFIQNFTQKSPKKKKKNIEL